MANDLNSAMGALRGLLGDNADEKIQSIMQSLSGGSSGDALSESENKNVGEERNNMSDDNLEYIMKIKSIIDEMSHSNDPRSNLLLSLKPYMRDSRKNSIDNILKIVSLTKFSGLFNKGNKS
ncbi:MAG: hypothetical protein N2171_06510 [Clostridia bacterium]|nr:hypothetical protein [Clostridia bacterium]